MMVPPASPKLTVVAVLTSVVFFLSLTVLEAIPEIPVDIDFKPFFIPLAFVALLPPGAPALAVGLGAALGEALRDLLEGYEIDDPVGFFGYILAFWVAGFVTGARRTGPLRLAVVGPLAAALQSGVEASSFLVFGEAGVRTAVLSFFGNIITHGVLLGTLPLLWLVPQLHGRVERYLGFEPRTA